ncbi:hypothetical protein ACVGW6_05300, partial [Enterobacter intestinihominis]
VVRSGGLTPALSHRVTGQKLKKATTLPFWFYLRVILNATNSKTTHNGSSIGEMGISSMVDISTSIRPVS